MLFSFFCSGHMFPLDMLPGIWGQIVSFLPLKYLAYFPAAVFLGKVTGPELARGLLLQAAWMLFFMLTCRMAYQRGLRRYSAYGG
jgi:ABC-2 type transport system permease protein